MSTAAAGVLTTLLLLGLPLDASADPSELPTPFGYNYGESETPRTAALGGALRSLGNGTAGMFLNPAAMTHSRVYHVEGLFQVTPEVDRLMAGAVIVDSMMNRLGLAGGISVLAGFLDQDGADWSTLDVRVGLAYPFADRFRLGVTGRYASVSQGSALPPPNGDGDAENDPVSLDLNAFTLDAGLTVKATDSLFISALAQNVASTHRGTFPMTLGGGLGFGAESFSIEVDGLVDLNSYEKATARLMAGGELLVADQVPIRAGYRFDQGANLHAVSAGLGYVGTEFAIEASVRRTLSSPGATTIVVGIAYYLETSQLMRNATEGYQ